VIVGRARELDALRAALARAARGDGAIAIVAGEAGVGKSHLIAAAGEIARGLGFDVAVGRCFASGAQRAFAPWREALGDLGADRRAEGLGAADARVRTFEAVLATLAARAASRPLLIAIEDLHWADRDSLLLFQHVARFGLGAALLVVATVRDPDLDAASYPLLDDVRAELAREPRCAHLALRPFGEPEVAELAAAIAGAAVPQALVRALCAETGGNPLYVRELVRDLVEGGRVAVRDGRVASDVATAELVVPATVRDVVRQRVARLPDDAAALVRVAALCADPIELAPLARAAELDDARALDAIDAAIAAGLVRAAGRRYELIHAIVRRAIHEAWSPDRRARGHRRLALALADAAQPDHAAIAAHFEASRDLPGAEAGVAPALAAAEAARSSGAPERAAAFVAIAAALCPPLGPPAIAEVRARLAIARAEAIEIEAALAATDDAVRALHAAAQDARVPALLADVAQALERGGAERADWLPLVARGLAAIGDRRDAAWARLAVLGRRLVPVVEGAAWVSRFDAFDRDAVRLLRDGGDEHDFAATVDPHDARAPAETAALLARIDAWTAPGPAIRVLDACMRDVFFRGDDLRSADALAERLATLSARVGALSGAVSADILLACTRAALGELDAARAALQRARAGATRLGAMHRMNAVGPFAAASMIAYLTGGDWGPIVARLVELVTSPRAAATPFGIVPLGLGLVGAAASGDAALADRLFPLHLQAVETLPVELNEWGATRDCGATAAWLLERRDLAPRYLAAMARGDRAGCACWSCADESRARLLALTGDLDGAIAAWARARAAFEASGRRPSRAICDVDEAHARVRAGEPIDRVAPLLDAAAPVLAELGMAPWQARAAALRTTRLPDGLTEREVEVLRLLAGGLANKEIAARLFISVPTVERHVANVYAKIGERGRAAATAYALRKGLLA